MQLFFVRLHHRKEIEGVVILKNPSSSKRFLAMRLITVLTTIQKKRARQSGSFLSFIYSFAASYRLPRPLAALLNLKHNGPFPLPTLL